jgi:hypothetical protein
MSGNFDPYSSPANPGAPPRRGMSAGVKILLGILAVGVLGIALCCGVGTYMGMSAFSTSPESIEALSDEIADINVGPPWKPMMGMDLTKFNVPLRMVMYWIDEKQPGNMMLLMDIEEDPDVLDHPEMFESQMRQKIDEQSEKNAKNMERLTVVSSEKIEMDVNGRPANITLNDAVGEDSGEQYCEVMAMFMGNENPTVLYLRVKEEVMSRDDVLAMLHSLED